ncbi:MAG: translation initiation factor IF-2 [Thermoguttaceae bacterium]
MAIRIYALAQQLKVEAKTIFDSLKHLGIEGKGSALAALNDDEVDLVKAALQKSASKPAIVATSSPDVPFQRPNASSQGKKIPVLTPSNSRMKAGVTHAAKEDVDVSSAGNTESDIPTASDSAHSDSEISAPISDVSPEPLPEKETELSELPESTSNHPVPHENVETIEPELKSEVVNEGDARSSEHSSSPITSPSLESTTSGHTLPPPIGHIDLSTISGPGRGSSQKGASPLKAFRKRTSDSVLPPPVEPVLPVEPAEPSPESASSPVTTGFSSPGHAASVRRDDYHGPLRVIQDKIPNLDSRRQKMDGDKSTGNPPASHPKTSGGVAVRLAPIPKAPVSKASKSKEPAPQKPDMKLPPELIRDTSVGAAKHLEDHIRKHDERHRIKEEERRAGDSKKPSKGKIIIPPAEFDGRISGKGGGKKRDVMDLAHPSALEEAKKRKRGSTFQKNRSDSDDENAVLPRQLKRIRNRGRSIANTAAPRKTDIVLQLPCSVKQFAEQTGLTVAMVIKRLFEIGIPAMINTQLDLEGAELLAESFDIRMSVRDQVSLEDQLVTSLFDIQDDPASLEPRPAVVTVLGHVDHGKTTLLDKIIGLTVASGEKGGITQHIRAYRVHMPSGEDITFVDTPGHEAFTEMRARGANCTDIAVLVVAADDGVMPQTEEAISHAKAAGVPIIVALNKMDLPGVNPDRVIQELAANDLLPSEWGGDVEVVRCSGLSGMGIDDLLRTIQVVAEMNELKANPNRPATGVALEAEMQAGQGVVCKVLVQNGTLRTGDVVLCGTAFGRVKVMYDALDTKRVIEEATPSSAVNLLGLDVAPGAGSRFCVLDDISSARIIAEQRLSHERKSELVDVQTHVTLETLFQRITAAQTIQTLNVIIRADVRGSIEAIRKELSKLDHPEVKIKILQASVGGITEADVQLADASDAIIVGFSVVPDENARVLADRKKIQIRRYDIIYNLTADIKAALEGMLKPIEQVKELGRALVQKVYVISRVGSIAGCRAISGTIERDCRIRIIRDSRIIGEYPLDSLKREKDDVKEVREGYECGMKLKGFNDLKEGDILEAYKIEEVARTF